MHPYERSWKYRTPVKLYLPAPYIPTIFKSLKTNKKTKIKLIDHHRYKRIIFRKKKDECCVVLVAVLIVIQCSGLR